MNRKRTTLEDKWAAEEAAATDPGPVPAQGDSDAEEVAQEPVDAEIEELRAQVASLTDQLRRQHAEMANFRRRTERARDEQREEAEAELLRGLLPVIDDFERALGAETDNLDAYRDGVELILKALLEFLGGVGVERIDPHGEPFDPHLHEAVDHSESDAVPAHHVAQVYQRGYRRAGRLLRPAVVGVARPPADETPAAGAADDEDNG